MYGFIEIGLRISMIAFFVFLEIPNVILFISVALALISRFAAFQIVYEATVVLSVIALFSLIRKTWIGLRDQFKRRDLAIFIAFYCPWILLAVAAVLLKIGFKLF